MSNVYTLATLNTLREKNGMKPLKAWKESKAKLEAACAKLMTKAPATDKNLKVTKEMKEGLGLKGKPAKAPKTAKPAKEKKDGISISTIAEELGIDPKVARAKLRRAFGDADGTGSDGRWVFTEAKAKEVREILKGDARKKT